MEKYIYFTARSGSNKDKNEAMCPIRNLFSQSFKVTIREEQGKLHVIKGEYQNA